MNATHATEKVNLSLYYDGTNVTPTCPKIDSFSFDIGNTDLKITSVIAGKILPHQSGQMDFTFDRSGKITHPSTIKLSADKLKSLKISATLMGVNSPKTVDFTRQDIITSGSDYTLYIKQTPTAITASLLSSEEKEKIEFVSVIITKLLLPIIQPKLTLFMIGAASYSGLTGLSFPKDSTGACTNIIRGRNTTEIKHIVDQIRERGIDNNNNPDKIHENAKELIKFFKTVLTDDVLRKFMSNTLRDFVTDTSNENINLLIAIFAEDFVGEVNRTFNRILGV